MARTNSTVQIIIVGKRRKFFMVPREKVEAFKLLLREYRIKRPDEAPAAAKPTKAAKATKAAADSRKSATASSPRPDAKLATVLRELRSRSGMSQIALARKVRLTQSEVSQFENGKRRVTPAIAQRFSKVFKHPELRASL
jgi:ribosome-binding protein aMBF1 (putative translation factor)